MTELTEYQKEQLEVYKERGLKLGLHSGPTDRAAAEEAMKEAYKCAGYDWPGTVFWAESPKALVALYEKVSGFVAGFDEKQHSQWKDEAAMLADFDNARPARRTARQ